MGNGTPPLSAIAKPEAEAEAAAASEMVSLHLEEEPTSSYTVLDLTSYQLHDLHSIELPPSVTELDLTANRLSSLDPRIAKLSSLNKLSLRQNFSSRSATGLLHHFKDNKATKYYSKGSISLPPTDRFQRILLKFMTPALSEIC